MGSTIVDGELVIDTDPRTKQVSLFSTLLVTVLAMHEVLIEGKLGYSEDAGVRLFGRR